MIIQCISASLEKSYSYSDYKVPSVFPTTEPLNIRSPEHANHSGTTPPSYWISSEDLKCPGNPIKSDDLTYHLHDPK